MSTSTSIQLEKIPSMSQLHRQILWNRKRKWQGESIASVRVECAPRQCRESHVQRYRQICHFADSDTIPMPYLHMIAFRLQLFIFTQPQFPFPLFGLIHLRNEITQFMPVSFDDKVQFCCEIGSSGQTEKGFSFDLIASAYIGDQKVWSSCSTYLYRNVKRKKPRGSWHNKTLAPWQTLAQWTLPKDLGWHYAKISGDYNIIHLHPWLARLFGFRQPLVHGMWLKARIIAHLETSIQQYPCRVSVDFKQPVFLPSDIVLGVISCDSEQPFSFEIRDPSASKRFLCGQVSYPQQIPYR